MNSQPQRNYTRIAVAIVAAAVIVAAALLATSSSGATITKTIPVTTPSIATTTITIYPTDSASSSTPDGTTTVTSISTQTLGNTTVTVTGTATAPAGSRLYEVTFKQSGDCTPTVYAAPWSVTLGPWTVAEPSNATLPIATNSGSAGPSDVNYSSITFSVPNGQYQYSIAVGWSFGNPSGVITVNGGDVMVLLQGPEVSCTMTSTAAG